MGGSASPAALSTIEREEYKDFSLKLNAQAGTEAKVVKAQVELTYGCNLHCVHCYTDCYNKPELIKKERTTEEIIHTLDELQEQGVLWICFTGGEIFMRKDFFQIYDHAKERGFLITLFTNGTMFTEGIVDHLKKNPPFSIEMSCHGATEETFDRVTQVPGSFKRFLKGVALLRSRGLPFKIKTNGMTSNKHELPKIKQLVESLGTAFRLSNKIYPRLNGDTTPCEYRLTPDEIVELEFSKRDLDEDDQACEMEKRQDLVPPPDDRLFRCGCGTTAVHINAWGKLGTCTWVDEPRADLGEKSVAEGIAEVFPKVRGARYETDTPCRSCRVYTLCNKMPSIARVENGDREQPVEHFCQTAFKRAERLLEQPVGMTEKGCA